MITTADLGRRRRNTTYSPTFWMDAEDVDEDELALAMSTELVRPVPSISVRRARSFSSLQDASDALKLLSGSSSSWRQTKPLLKKITTLKPQDSTGPSLTNLDPKPITIHDRSVENQDFGNSDGLWATSVTVSQPSIVRGTNSKGLNSVSGYVVWLCTVETFEVKPTISSLGCSLHRVAHSKRTKDIQNSSVCDRICVLHFLDTKS